MKPSVCPWWEGAVKEGLNNTSDSTLIGCLDALTISGRSAESPLRIPVLDRFYERGTIVMGKIESGRVRKGDKLVMMPCGTECRVEQIYVNETQPVFSAKPGENVNLKLTGIAPDEVCKGFVICSPPPARACISMERRPIRELVRAIRPVARVL